MKPRFSTDYFKKGTKEIIYIEKNKPITRIMHLDKIGEFLKLGLRKDQLKDFIRGRMTAARSSGRRIRRFLKRR